MHFFFVTAMIWQFEALYLQPKLKNMRLSGNKMNSRRQVALFERNPVCRLCYQICLDLAEDYGGVQFDLLRSLEVADALCERILRNPWELQGVDQYYHWIEGRLGCDRPTMACALATVCVTLRCIDNPPASVKRLARDLKGLIIGDANNLYGELLSTAKRQAISIDADTYGDIPPLPKPQRELQELQRKCAEATTEIQTLKSQLKMEQEQQDTPKTIVYNYGTYIAEQHNDIHDNHNCRIYATAQPEEKEEADGAEEREEEDCGNSFFAARFPEDVVRKNIREAIDFASSKADACRRIMALETQGYIILSNVGDDRKAELINPYAQPKITLTGEDFKKARNRR